MMGGIALGSMHQHRMQCLLHSKPACMTTHQSHADRQAGVHCCCQPELPYVTCSFTYSPVPY
jgi:hypothetical protein